MIKYPIVILCGGLGTRIKSVLGNTPKILADINNKTFLEIQFENLYKNGLRDFIYLTGFNSDLIQPNIKKLEEKYLDCNIIVVNEGKYRLGTGGCLLNNINHINDNIFLLTYGDNYLRINYQGLVDKLEESDDACILSIYKNNNNFDRSNIVFNEKQKLISKYSKVQSQNMFYIDYGISAWKKCELMELDIQEKVFGLELLIQKFISNKNLGYYKACKRFYEIGTPESLDEFKNYVAANNV